MRAVYARFIHGAQMPARSIVLPCEWEPFLLEMNCMLLPASATCVNYELIRWQRWLMGHRLQWQEVTHEHVQQWLQAVSTQAHATVVKRSWVLRKLYEWAQQAEHVQTRPWLRIARPIYRG